VGKRNQGPPLHGFGHHHGPAPQFHSRSASVWGFIQGQWYQGQMTFLPGGSVHLDPSAVHIGSLTNQNFVVHDGTRWFNMHVNHDRDGDSSIYTTPIGHSPVPPWTEFVHPHTLPPLPELHLFDGDDLSAAGSTVHGVSSTDPFGHGDFGDDGNFGHSGDFGNSGELGNDDDNDGWG
jgi:hypothetical protein